MRAVPVVNHLIWIGNREKANDLSPLKVQKMLYFLHGWYLAVTGEKLLDEGFQKWEFGPVIPSIHDALRKYGSFPVDDYLTERDPETGDEQVFFVNAQTRPQFLAILERVWQEYSKFSATQLSTLTHQANTPWSRTPSRETIPDELIRDYFIEQANTTKARND